MFLARQLSSYFDARARKEIVLRQKSCGTRRVLVAVIIAALSRRVVVANTLDLFRNGAVGFIDWLDYQPGDLSNVPILIDSKCKNIHTLSACAGVHENLVPLSAPQAQRSPTFF
jgi:hypothetical protein